MTQLVSPWQRRIALPVQSPSFTTPYRGASSQHPNWRDNQAGYPQLGRDSFGSGSSGTQSHGKTQASQAFKPSAAANEPDRLNRELAAVFERLTKSFNNTLGSASKACRAKADTAKKGTQVSKNNAAKHHVGKQNEPKNKLPKNNAENAQALQKELKDLQEQLKTALEAFIEKQQKPAPVSGSDSTAASTQAVIEALTDNTYLQERLTQLAKDPGQLKLMQHFYEQGGSIRVENDLADDAPLGQVRYYNSFDPKDKPWMEMNLDKIEARWNSPMFQAQDGIVAQADTMDQYLEIILAHELYHTAQILNPEAPAEGNNTAAEEGMNTVMAINDTLGTYGEPKLSQLMEQSIFEAFGNIYANDWQKYNVEEPGSKSDEEEFEAHVSALESLGVDDIPVWVAQNNTNIFAYAPLPVNRLAQPPMQASFQAPETLSVGSGFPPLVIKSEAAAWSADNTTLLPQLDSQQMSGFPPQLLSW
jgi:hypothetical protein